MSRSSGKRKAPPKTGDELEYEEIAAMSYTELLDYATSQPHLLCDSYYRGFDTAIYDRVDQLRREVEAQGCSMCG